MSDAAPVHSLQRRFTVKLGANVAGVLLSFLQSVVVSRALGPRAYGNYNFLASFFNQFVGFIDMRSSTYLYTAVSSTRGRTGIVRFYFWLALAISAITLLVPAAAAALGVQNLIWPDQKISIVLLLAVVCLALWYADLLGKLCDALGLTVSFETRRTANAAVFFVLLLALIHWNLLDLRGYAGFILAMTASLLLALALLLRRSGALAAPERTPLREHFRDVFSYSHPLFVYTLAGLATNYADRWLLQRFAGSTQQGYFSLALNMGLAFDVAITALHPLLMREFAISFAGDDVGRARELFRKLIPLSYAVSAFFLCFAAMYADVCVRIVGGNAFRDAAPVWAVLAFLPIIHNYSLLSGSVLYAANKTRLLRNIGLAMTIPSLAAAWLLIAPAAHGGLGLGAVGAAVKTVALELLGTNVILFFNARMLKLSFARLLVHQIVSVAVFTALAYGAKQAGMQTLLGGGAIYVIAGGALFWLVPSLFGTDKASIAEVIRQVRR
jgi:O-antigen/teichoic acid export membrane protein